MKLWAFLDNWKINFNNDVYENNVHIAIDSSSQNYFDC